MRGNAGKDFVELLPRAFQEVWMKPPLTIPEAAKRITIGISTLRRYIRRKQITVIVLPGGDQRIDEDDLNDFLNSRKITRKR